MKHQENFDITQIPLWKVVFAATSNQDYEMNRVLYVEGHPKYGDRLLVQGYHCSCFEFDETKWDATWYTEKELKQVVQKWGQGEIDGYADAEPVIAPLILRYLR